MQAFFASFANGKAGKAMQKSRCTKSAAALRGVTSQPALCDDPPHTGQVDPTQQMLQYDQHGILLSDRPFQPNSPFSKNRSSLVKLPPPKKAEQRPKALKHGRFAPFVSFRPDCCRMPVCLIYEPARCRIANAVVVNIGSIAAGSCLTRETPLPVKKLLRNARRRF